MDLVDKHFDVTDIQHVHCINVRKDSKWLALCEENTCFASNDPVLAGYLHVQDSGTTNRETEIASESQKNRCTTRSHDEISRIRGKYTQVATLIC